MPISFILDICHTSGIVTHGIRSPGDVQRTVPGRGEGAKRKCGGAEQDRHIYHGRWAKRLEPEGGTGRKKCMANGEMRERRQVMDLAIGYMCSHVNKKK